MAAYEKGNLCQISIADFNLDPAQPRKVVDPDAAVEIAQKTVTKIGNIDTSAWRDEERESFRVTLVELRAKIDSFLSPNSAPA